MKYSLESLTGASCSTDTQCTSQRCVNTKCEAGESNDPEFICAN